MATFTINGFDIRSDGDKTVTQADAAQLQYVSPLGTATLDYRYATNDAESAEVSLTDYNLILNGTHLNDAPLPERIEMFMLTWVEKQSLQTAQVINLSFDNAIEGWRDFMFSVNGAALPDLSGASDISQFFAAATMTVPALGTTDVDYSIQLDRMPGVEVSGVIAQLFEAQDVPLPDRFDFVIAPGDDAQWVMDDQFATLAGAANLLADQTPQPDAHEADINPISVVLIEAMYDDFGQ